MLARRENFFGKIGAVGFATRATMKQYKIVLLLLLVSSVYVAFAQNRLQTTGRVLDSEGAGIRNALVLVHWDDAGSSVGLSSNIGIRHDISVKTDSDGRFALDLPSGFYDVFISSQAFTPAALKIRVRGGIAAPIEVRLKADPLVTKELGHTYKSPEPVN